MKCDVTGGTVRLYPNHKVEQEEEIDAKVNHLWSIVRQGSTQLQTQLGTMRLIQSIESSNNL